MFRADRSKCSAVPAVTTNTLFISNRDMRSDTWRVLISGSASDWSVPDQRFANAMAVWHEGGQLLDRLLDDTQVVEALGEEALRGFFDLDYHFKHVDTIFARVFA